MLKEIKKTLLLLLVAAVLIFFVNTVKNNSMDEIKDYSLNKISALQSKQEKNNASNTSHITMKKHNINPKDKRCNELIAKSWSDKSVATLKAKNEACAHNRISKL